MRRRWSTQPSVPEDSTALPCMESAHLSGDSFQNAALRQALARRYTFLWVIVSMICISGPLLQSLYGEWDFIFSFGTLPADTRVMFYMLSLYGSTMIVAAAFPVNPASEVGAKFTFVPVVVCAVLRCFGVCLDLYHNGHHATVGCTVVHWLASIVVFATWVFASVQGVRRRVTWYIARCVHAMEGTAFILCALLMRALGPAAHYPPGAMSFPAALFRGLLAVTLSAVILKPLNRIRMSQVANRFGWNHVTVGLGELTSARRGEVGGVGGASLPSVSLDASSDSQARSHHSHYTAKVGHESPFREEMPTSPAESHHTTKLGSDAQPCQVFLERSRQLPSEASG